jgi:hypothetical protein
MKKYFLLLQQQPIAILLLTGIPLLVLGVILFYMGIRAMQAAQPVPTATIAPTLPSQQALLVPATGNTAPPPRSNALIRLAWFYKPPEKSQMDLVAKNFDFFILTYKDETERDQLKASGVPGPFSQYLLLLSINDPGDCQETPIGNQVAYKAGDFCQISESHPDWFLLDGKGHRIQGSGHNYYMDPGNEGFRRFWLERAREMQESYGWDGIFLDNVEASRAKILDDGNPAKYPDDKSYQEAVYGFLEYIRQNYFQPHGKPMYGNIVSVNDDAVREHYLQQLDGVMLESFATDWSNGYREHDDWEQQLNLADWVLSQGKTIILVSQGDEKDHDRQKFAFASYLLVADGNAVFRYANSDSYREVWLYDNYKLDLGTALGNRYKKQGAWRRDFSNGYVTVNPKTHTAEIVKNQ